MNLISDPWIPVRRNKPGESEYVCPWQLTEGHAGNPVVAIDFPRPDLSSSVITFLIGLIQAAMTPDSLKEWHRLYIEPPEPNVLRAALAAFEEYFQFDGPGARCFQDFELTDDKAVPISALLIDQPGGQTKRNNVDLFIKRDQFPQLGLSAAIAALITMQSSAPAGGQGHRTSLRGGGPLNTLLTPDPMNDELPFSLWRLIWINVLHREALESLSGNDALKDPSAIFPWLSHTRTSEAKTGQDTYPEDAHPLQMYFGMPRRIRLNLDELPTGKCPLTQNEGPLVKSYRSRNFGTNYQGAWIHPLSPYRFDKGGLPIALHPQPGGIGYRHWLHLTFGSGDTGGKDQIRPARVVQAAHDTRKNQRRTLIWAFGFDMDNMKARGWYESQMPIYHLDDGGNEALADRAAALIEAAQFVCSNLRQAVKRAWFSERTSISGDLGFVTQSFWQSTESSFFVALQLEYDSIRSGGEEPDRRFWLQLLHQESMQLFDHFTASGNIVFENPKRIALARRDLGRFNFKKPIQDRLRISGRAA